MQANGTTNFLLAVIAGILLWAFFPDVAHIAGTVIFAVAIGYVVLMCAYWIIRAIVREVALGVRRMARDPRATLAAILGSVRRGLQIVVVFFGSLLVCLVPAGAAVLGFKLAGPAGFFAGFVGSVAVAVYLIRRGQAAVRCPQPVSDRVRFMAEMEDVRRERAARS